MLILWTACALATLPAALIVWNLTLYRPPRAATGFDRFVSVLIPARDEEARIAAALDALLASRHAHFEVLVLDDHSSDATAEVVARCARRDERVRLLRGAPLPRGAGGKAFACAQLADAARGDILVFVDADVGLAPDAVGRIAAELEHSGAALLSGVPRQITGTWSEKLLLPLIHFVLLGYLPVAAMRRYPWRALGAACGQLCAVKRAPYAEIGGHRSILASFHDGVALARRFRGCGFRTELTDLTRLAECRMYDSAAAVVSGLAKNAHEGLGSPGGILPWSILLLGGQVLPAAALIGAVFRPGWLLPAAIAVAASYAGRIALAGRFEHERLGVALHPVAVALLVGIQWYALLRRALGRPVRWKGRAPERRRESRSAEAR